MSVTGPVNNEAGIRSELPLFEEIFKLYHRKVYAICMRMTGEPTEAEDLTQEVFVQVFRKLDTFRGESAFTTWLHRLTINQVLMHFRKRRSIKMDLTEDGELPERTIQGGNILKSLTIVDRLALDEAILRLAPGYRTVFILHDIEGLEHQEIGNILGCSVGTSKSQLHKARMKLRSLLRPLSQTGKGATASQPIHQGLDRLPASQSRPALGPLPTRSQLNGFSPAQA
jgi:RNA polymerase sigma-70 factor (ECF subfamily)